MRLRLAVTGHRVAAFPITKGREQYLSRLSRAAIVLSCDRLEHFHDACSEFDESLCASFLEGKAAMSFSVHLHLL